MKMPRIIRIAGLLLLLLPTVQAENVRRALVDYLSTTFALSDDDARDGLDRVMSR